MSMRDALLPEFDHEIATTRRVLARVPDAELGWRPHEKSMSLGELSGHIAALPMWCRVTLETVCFDVETLGGQQIQAPVSCQDLLAGFDAQTGAARERLAAVSDAELLAPWTLKKGAQEIFSMPRASTIRMFVLNHLIHHRGQLSVYLRMRNVPVPSIYGPTADEQ